MSVTEKLERRIVTDDEVKEVFSVPAPGVNRFFATLGPIGLRLAFAEEANGVSHIRSAVIMHPADGVKLYKLLIDQLQEIEPLLEKAREEHENNG